MPLWRRKESLHERLARQGGLPSHELPIDTRPAFETGIHGIPRPREWDAVVAVEAAGLRGENARFVTLADGTVVVEEASADDDLAPLADALEGVVQAPYRAHATRRSGDVWAVGARRIDVLELEEEPGGDELSLTHHEGHRELLVDGARTFGSLRSLERWAIERYGESFALTAERLDGPLWEVRAAPL